MVMMCPCTNEEAGFTVPSMAFLCYDVPIESVLDRQYSTIELEQ